MHVEWRLFQAVSLRRAVELALDASRGLAYMHSKKPSPIVHRDLKPANLMVAGNLYQVRVHGHRRGVGLIRR